MARTYTAGIVTAYGAAKEAGYTGTYEEFCEQQAGFAGNAAQVAEDRAAVETIKNTFETVTVPAAVQTIQTEGATQEAAVTAKGTEQVAAVRSAGDAQTGRVQMAGAEEVQDIETAGTTQVGAVNTAGATQVNAVNAAGTTQTGNVNDAGATQMAAIEAKGEETRESIPEDYSTLTAEVSDLKSSLTSAKGLVFEIGSLSSGVPSSSTKYARTAEFNKITKGAPIIFNSSNKLLRLVVYFYTSASDASVILPGTEIDVAVGQSQTIYVPSDCYFKVRVTWIPQSDITTADLELFSQLFSYYIPESYERIEALQEQVTAEHNTNTAQQQQIDSAIPIINMDGLEIGGITQGNNNTDDRYVRCATYYPINKGETIKMKSSSLFAYNITFCVYSKIGGGRNELITSSADYSVAKNGSTQTYITPASGYIRFRAVALPASTVTEDKLNEFKTLMSYQQFISLTIAKDAIKDATRNYNVLSVNHRGYSSAPENTLIAFKESKLHGFDYVETDIRFTSDGVAVLLHDASINRTARNADGTAISGTVNIADITYEQALTYDFGIYKGSEYAGTKIPTYEDFLALCRSISLVPCIELKAGTREQVYALYDLAAQYGLKNSAIWVSQTFTYLAYIRDYSDATLVFCRSAYTSDTQYLKNDGNKVIVGLPSAGITAETVSACIAADYEIWQYTIEIASDISENQYVTGYLTNTINVGETLYNQAMT